MAQIISITHAKQQLLQLARRTEELGESFVIVKDARPISALLPFDEYESLLETLDILETEPDIAKKLRATTLEMAKGQFVVWKKPAIGKADPGASRRAPSKKAPTLKRK